MTDAEKETLEGFIKAGRLNQGQLTAIRSLLAEAEAARCDDGCVPMAEYDRVLAENYDLRHHAYGSGLPEHDDGMPDLLTAAEARIEAALALYESAMEIPPLAEQMVKALKGGE